jgi:hypothetical protein
VRRAADLKQASYDNDRIDRAIVAAAESVEGLTQRKFYPNDGTKSFDWPNYQYAYPWELWLDQHEMAAQPTLVVTGSLLPEPIEIPAGNYIMQPINDGPPYTKLELRRDQDSAFGYNTTPQLDIAITGTFGYWMMTSSSGTFTSSVGSSDTVVNVSSGTSPGVGDMILADSERMVVTDSSYTSTSLAFTSGITTAQSNDNVGAVSSGADFSVGEIILVDFEWMLIQNIVGNNLVVKRGYDGSIITTHSGGDIWASRQLSVLRGQLGTTAATHSEGDDISINQVPSLISELAVAEALVWLAQEPSAYGGQAAPRKSTVSTRSGGDVNESQIGTGVYDLRARVAASKYSRDARSRVV